MEFLPKTQDPLVLRTDFDDDDAWTTICGLIRRPRHDMGSEFVAYVEFLENRDFRDLSVQELLERVPADYNPTFIFVADKAAMEPNEFPVLVVDLYDERGRTFRAIPSQIQGIENNLSIANMSFYDFADNVDDDGVFRDFKDP
jgi:hypothetical protein